MPMKRLVLLLFALAACACVTTSQATEPGGKSVTMFVGVEGTLQPAVKVFSVKNDGTRALIGRTGESGGLALDPEAIRQSGAVCLLFEKEGYFTGAIWLSGYEFSDPDYIALAKFALP